MKNFVHKLVNLVKENYDYNRLIDQQILEPISKEDTLEQIISDIDKTYLETEFESFRKIVRIAFEDSLDKKTVKGAADFFRVLRWTFEDEKKVSARPLHFVSSSPPQLRNVLREKFSYDGLEWNSDTFKNQAYNLLRIRVDQLKQHIAYKSVAILKLLTAADEGTSFYFVGDNVELDAYIYVGVGLYAESILSADGYSSWLKMAGVEPMIADKIVMQYKINSKINIRGIYIRKVANSFLNTDFAVAKPISLFNNFYELMLIAIRDRLLGQHILPIMTRKFINHHGIKLKHIIESYLRVFDLVISEDSGFQEFKAVIDKLGNKTNLLNTTDPKSLKDWLNGMSEAEILTDGKKWYSNLHLSQNALQ